MLQFPNARLHLYSQLMESKAGCIKTMFNCAYDFGLVPSDSLDQCAQPDESSMCGSMWAARKIIEGYFDGHKNGSSPAELIEKVWSSLQQAVESYKSKSQLLHNRTAGALPDVSECSRMAPVVFDLLLQHLRSHS